MEAKHFKEELEKEKQKFSHLKAEFENERQIFKRTGLAPSETALVIDILKAELEQEKKNFQKFRSDAALEIDHLKAALEHGRQNSRTTPVPLVASMEAKKLRGTRVGTTTGCL